MAVITADGSVIFCTNNLPQRQKSNQNSIKMQHIRAKINQLDLIKVHRHISPSVLIAYLPLLCGLTEVGIITLVAHY